MGDFELLRNHNKQTTKRYKLNFKLCNDEDCICHYHDDEHTNTEFLVHELFCGVQGYYFSATGDEHRHSLYSSKGLHDTIFEISGGAVISVCGSFRLCAESRQ